MFEKLKKRRGFPVDGLDGVFIRLLTQGEKPRLKIMRALPPEQCGEYTAEDLHNALSLGFILVSNIDGEQCITPKPEEADVDFAKRVIKELADVGDYELKLIGEAFGKLCKGERVPLDNIAKN